MSSHNPGRMNNLHFVGWTFTLRQQKESIQPFLKILQMKVLTDSLTKSITVFKFPRRQERSVQVDELVHSLYRDFPEQALVGGASGYVNGSE